MTGIKLRTDVCGSKSQTVKFLSKITQLVMCKSNGSRTIKMLDSNSLLKFYCRSFFFQKI